MIEERSVALHGVAHAPQEVRELLHREHDGRVHGGLRVRLVVADLVEAVARADRPHHHAAAGGGEEHAEAAREIAGERGDEQVAHRAVLLLDLLAALDVGEVARVRGLHARGDARREALLERAHRLEVLFETRAIAAPDAALETAHLTHHRVEHAAAGEVDVAVERHPEQTREQAVRRILTRVHVVRAVVAQMLKRGAFVGAAEACDAELERAEGRAAFEVRSGDHVDARTREGGDDGVAGRAELVVAAAREHARHAAVVRVGGGLDLAAGDHADPVAHAFERRELRARGPARAFGAGDPAVRLHAVAEEPEAETIGDGALAERLAVLVEHRVEGGQTDRDRADAGEGAAEEGAPFHGRFLQVHDHHLTHATARFSPEFSRGPKPLTAPIARHQRWMAASHSGPMRVPEWQLPWWGVSAP